MAPKYPFFNEEFKFLVQTFHYQILKQSIFEASEALQKWDGMILKKTRLFRWFSSNSQVEATSASLNSWSNKTLDIPIFIITYLWTIFPYLIFVRTILRCVAAPTLNEGERSPFCSAVVVGTQWVQTGKTRLIKVHLMFHEFFPCKFQKRHKIRFRSLHPHDIQNLPNCCRH